MAPITPLRNVPPVDHKTGQWSEHGKILIQKLTDQVTSSSSSITTIQGTAPKLLNTLTASGSSSLSDTTSLTSAYSVYRLEFIALVPATTATIPELQIHSGGSFQNTGYNGTIWIYNTSGTASRGNTTTFIPLLDISAANTQSNGANTSMGLSGWMEIYNPSSTSAPKNLIGQLAAPINTTPQLQGANVAYSWTGGNGAVDGFQLIYSSSSNITSGIIKVWGYP